MILELLQATPGIAILLSIWGAIRADKHMERRK